MKRIAIEADATGDRRSRLRMRPESGLGTLLALLFVVISLVNGAPFFLARTGLIDPAPYQRDRQAFCPEAGPPAGLVSACPARRPHPWRPRRLQSLSFGRLHEATEPWRPWKLSRFLLLLGLPLAASIAMGRACLPSWIGLRPVLPLLISTALAALISLLQLAQSPQAPAHQLASGLLGAVQVLLVSALPGLWLLPLLAAGPFSTRDWLHHWARASSWLLWLQLPLLMFEALRGLPMPFGPALVGGSAVGTSVQAGLAIPSRLVGSFTQPNSLGVAAVVLLAFAISYLPHHKTGPPRASSRFMAVPMGSDSVYRGGLYSAEPLNRSVGEGLDSPAIDQSGTRSDPSVSLRGLWIVALLSVLLARSGTGLIVLLALFLWSASQQWPALFHRSRLALAATTVLLMTFLPNLLGRPDLWRSPLGRWQAAVEGMTQAGPLQWLFGQGLAANSNQLISLLGPQSALHSGSSDGMPVLLLLQSGLFGVAAFYGLLLWAWNRDPVSRPFLMAVGIVSLTLNITELFPINLLLAFGLAGLLAPSPQSMLPVKS